MEINNFERFAETRPTIDRSIKMFCSGGADARSVWESISPHEVERIWPTDVPKKRRKIELTETDLESALQGELLDKLEEKGIEKREFLREIKKRASEKNIEISEDMIENIGNLILLMGKKTVEEE